MHEYADSKIEAKTRTYLRQLLTTQKFKTVVKSIRERHSVPASGFDIRIFDELVVAEVFPRIPSAVVDVKEFSDSINRLLLRYGFSKAWFTFFSDLILFDWIGDVANLRQILLMNLGGTNRNRARDIEALDEHLLSNPIVVLIPPFASQRDINDFISLNWEQIEKIQNQYGKKDAEITKMRRKSSRVELRNQFIYENRELPKRELMKKVTDQFGDVLDYSYLGKIIASQVRKISDNA
jgi:hypothetical protein